MRRPKIGDIVEVPTKKGLAYAQYTHKNAKMGPLLRVFDAQFPARPTHFASIATLPVQFSTFFPLGAAVHRGIFAVVAHENISAVNLAFPVFKNGVPDPGTNKVTNWWLWDGEKEWPVGKLTEEQKSFPDSQIVNDTMLVHLIETGWTSKQLE